jgi:pyruvate dehydrogenase E2 component (dihydrolipoamide acetyltransferase)
MADVEMPQLGETVTEGTITRWFKQVGEQVERDEPLFEVSTDKVDSEVPSPAAGVLTEILVEEGETVDVGTRLAVLGDGSAAPAEAPAEQEAAADEPAPEPEPEPAPQPEPAPAAEAPAPEPAPEPEPATAPAPAAEAPAPAPAAPADQAPAPAPAPPAAGGNGGGAGILLSPVVRRLVSEHQLDPSTIQGTGMGGRITRADVEQVIQGRAAEARTASRPEPPAAPRPAAAPPTSAPAPPAPAPAAAAPSQPARPAPVARSGDRDTVVPLNNIRRRTGEHMVQSKTVAPHVLTAVEVDFEGVDRVRRAHKDQFQQEEGFSLTYLPFVSRAVVDAIEDFPHLNATVGEGEVVLHHDVNLAIAVDLQFEGLLAPVVQSADGKRLRAIAREVHDLAGRARTKKLSADEIVGGTFTITNPGQYGTFMQFPIINQPQVAILSTDGVKRRPVVVQNADGDESIAIHSVGILALAWDHRAFDGAYAAAFLHRLREIIETRDWEAEL